MKKTVLTLSLLFTLCMSAGAQYVDKKEEAAKKNKPLSEWHSIRSTLLNFGWKFLLGNPEGAERPDFNDSGWRTLDLPHDFQFEQPWDETAKGARAFKQMCDGWYRKTLFIPAEYKGMRVMLDFGGIMYYGDVYVNGKKVASSEYGYIGFETDISRAVKYGADNVVAVYSSTGPVNGSRWYTGGGLFRNVYLKVCNQQTRIARHGLYVTSAPAGQIVRPDVLDAQRISINPLNPQGGNPNGVWDVLVQMQIMGWQNHNITLKATLKDAESNVVGQTQCGMPDHTKQNNTEVALPFISVKSPQLWSPDSPYLYSVEAVVEEDGTVIDSVSTEIGLRTIEYSPKFGFKLNGKKTFLVGIANHHDLGAVGIAAYDKAVERQMRQLKAFGYNAIRCSHNPYSEGFYRAADKVGLMVVDELIDKWSDKDYWGGRKPFMQLWPSLITEWVKRDRNHPSIVLWSLGNELQTRSDWSGYPTEDWGITTYRIFDQMLKRYDRTRPTTVAMFPARAGAQRGTPDFKTYRVPPELACASEVASFNYQWDAYPGYFEYKPDLILFQSEAVTNQLQQPYFGMDRDRSVGLAWWGAIEYWGESNGWPKKGWNYSFFRHTLLPYPQAYLIKGSIQPDVPVCRIGVVDGKGENLEWNDIKVGSQKITENWNRPEGSHQNVFVYTNADEVELYHNGKSLGTQQNNRMDVTKVNMTYWNNIDYGKGGTLLAVARSAGREVARHEIQTTGKAVALKIIAEGPSPETTFDAKTDVWKADGMDLQYFRVCAVDKKGRIVPNATDQMTVTVEGEGTLLAIDNGDHYTNELFRANDNTKSLQSGVMQAIVRSKQTPGKVTLKATSPTLKSAKLTINTK